jgi:hypothetical protein
METEEFDIMEIEVIEHKRRYLTIKVTPEMANNICLWTLQYNPTAEEEQMAIDAVKSAELIKEEIMIDSYEIGSVDFPNVKHEDENTQS